MLIYSSIRHIAWIILGGLRKSNILLIYFLFYCVTRFAIISLAIKRNINSIQIQIHNGQIALLINMCSLAGLPPFLGFFFKWLIIFSIKTQPVLIITILLLLIFSRISTYVYITLCYSALLLHENTNLLKRAKNKLHLFFHLFLPISFIFI